MSSKIRREILGPIHPDIAFLKQELIGGVIAKGLSATVEAQPKNPIDYFAKWLLNYKAT